MVTGIVAELLSRDTSLTSVQLKKLIKDSGDLDEALEGKIPSKKHINAEAAYALLLEQQRKN